VVATGDKRGWTNGRTDEKRRGRQTERQKYGHGFRRNTCLVVNNNDFHEIFAVVFYWLSNLVDIS